MRVSFSPGSSRWQFLLASGAGALLVSATVPGFLATTLAVEANLARAGPAGLESVRQVILGPAFAAAPLRRGILAWLAEP
jgi:hypothetical protein